MNQAMLEFPEAALPKKCIQTINAKEARINEGAKIINMAFANKPTLRKVA